MARIGCSKKKLPGCRLKSYNHVLLSLLLQRYLVRGLSLGAVKG
jgi:hypothetical protein